MRVKIPEMAIHVKGEVCRSLSDAKWAFEKYIICKIGNKHNWIRTRMAKEMAIDYHTLKRKLALMREEGYFIPEPVYNRTPKRSIYDIP